MLFEVKIPFHVSLLARTPVCETGLDREPTNSNSFLNFCIFFIEVGWCVKIFSEALKSNTTLFAMIFTGKPVSVLHFILIALCSHGPCSRQRCKLIRNSNRKQNCVNKSDLL